MAQKLPQLTGWRYRAMKTLDPNQREAASAWPCADEELVPELPPERFRIDWDRRHVQRPVVRPEKQAQPLPADEKGK
jgi:hypothetical protein